MALTIVNAQQVRDLLPMAECIDVMEEAMLAASQGTIAVPPRMGQPLIDGSGNYLLMPGSSAELGSYGAKLISLHPRNAQQGLPVIQGFVALFEHETGTPVAIIEGAQITALRTAAASGLATRLLAREDASSCGIFGTGVQALTHIDAIRAVRPVQEILVWARDLNKAEDFAASQAQRTGIAVRATADPAEAAGCDVICTLTGSTTPILKGEWVQPGAHVNLVGAHSLTTREADSDLIAKSAVYVDLLESCRNEGGDVMIPVQEGLIDESHIRGEIGQLLAGVIDGRGDSQQITLYKSLGMTAQDLYAARYVYDKARAAQLGTTIDF
jgi:ornithine cyclodeaminase/alanine dehydrogenase-like protein (mu-crystallin family)